MSIDRTLVNQCLDALADRKIIHPNYKENFRRHVEAIIETLDADGLLYTEPEEE